MNSYCIENHSTILLLHRTPKGRRGQLFAYVYLSGRRRREIKIEKEKKGKEKKEIRYAYFTLSRRTKRRTSLMPSRNTCDRCAMSNSIERSLNECHLRRVKLKIRPFTFHKPRCIKKKILQLILQVFKLTKHTNNPSIYKKK